jgi:Na+/H+ antiporter NhaD/arsenite permease-like protein
VILTLAAAAIAILLLVTGVVRWSGVAIDVELLLVLFALLMAVEILRASGYLDLLVKRAMTRFRTTRSFGFAMVMFSGVLAMFVTNDVALFVVIPFTVIASRFSDFDVEDAVILEIVSVNLIGCLTPLGNPQNLFVYHRAGWNAGEFVLVMLPFVGWCTAGLIAALFFFVFIIVAGAATLGWKPGEQYFTAVGLSQVISNVPATILLSGSAHNAWRELLYGANAGGCGTIIASLANLLGWRIYLRESNRDPRFFRRLTIIELAFLGWAGVGGWMLL